MVVGSLALFNVLLSMAYLQSPNANSEVKDPDGMLENWDPTLVDPCTWFHVTCNSDNRVTQLDLGNAKLSGRLVPELGKLGLLQYPELYMNNLEGPIPKEIGGLKSLVSLDLYHNNLTGSIPSVLSGLSNLKFLRLNIKRLNGRISWQLTQLGNLKISQDVSNNDLCGTIPTSGSSKFSEESYSHNLRLEGPELMGFVRRRFTSNDTLTCDERKLTKATNFLTIRTNQAVVLISSECHLSETSGEDADRRGTKSKDS
ncbi:hypothetical protein SAY87_013588 [Trapa incisa]|uniref:Leucine-rich repeat-containing N-terminal plant-type domain-containing protein n=1 Tax=Trapa incisa TaxID=236973 RepID=A0AAN7QGA3_9MYRT|nr:hypothetical protein SAY87_013588 [Trapa incisa]